MINTCSPNKGLLRTVVILYYHWKRQAALLSQIYSLGTDRKENTLWTVSNKAFIVVPCLVVTQQRFLLPLSKETATVYRVYSCMKNSTLPLTRNTGDRNELFIIIPSFDIRLILSYVWPYLVLKFHPFRANNISTLDWCNTPWEFNGKSLHLLYKLSYY
jgi:hypothetical protein